MPSSVQCVLGRTGPVNMWLKRNMDWPTQPVFAFRPSGQGNGSKNPLREVSKKLSRKNLMLIHKFFPYSMICKDFCRSKDESKVSNFIIFSQNILLIKLVCLSIKCTMNKLI